jgi:hypothetical protein
VILVGERLHLTDAQIGVRDALTSKLEQGPRGIKTEHTRAAVRDQAQKRPDAAADVEHELPRLEVDPPQRLLIRRPLLILAERPVPRPSAPQRPPPLRASTRAGSLAGRRHVHSLTRL